VDKWVAWYATRKAIARDFKKRLCPVAKKKAKAKGKAKDGQNEEQGNNKEDSD
jgi:hypothetical protein